MVVKKSGLPKGVRKHHNRFEARYKRKCIGQFDTADEAHQAYLDAFVNDESHKVSNTGIKNISFCNTQQNFRLQKIINGKRYYSHHKTLEEAKLALAELEQKLGGNTVKESVLDDAIPEKLPKGVRKSGTKFKATLCVDGDSTYLGTFCTVAEASQAYLDAYANYELSKSTTSREDVKSITLDDILSSKDLTFRKENFHDVMIDYFGAKGILFTVAQDDYFCKFNCDMLSVHMVYSSLIVYVSVDISKSYMAGLKSKTNRMELTSRVQLDKLITDAPKDMGDRQKPTIREFANAKSALIHCVKCNEHTTRFSKNSKLMRLCGDCYTEYLRQADAYLADNSKPAPFALNVIKQQETLPDTKITTTPDEFYAPSWATCWACDEFGGYGWYQNKPEIVDGKLVIKGKCEEVRDFITTGVTQPIVTMIKK